MQIVKGTELEDGTYGKLSYDGKYVIKEVQKFIDNQDDEKYCNINYEKTTFHEIIFLSTYKHPNIIKPIMIYTTQDSFKIYMKDKKMDLHTYIHLTKQEDRMKNIYKIFYQIACGLLYLHNNNLQHGDLKPRNIMYNNGKIKLIDFGSIMTFRSSYNVSSYTNICTYPYRAPELFSAQTEHISPMMDIWSLGVVLYYFITGCYPTSIQTEQIYMEQIKNNIKKGNEYINITKMLPDNLHLLAELNEKMLTYDYTKRITIKQIIHDKLFNDTKGNFRNNYMSSGIMDKEIIIGNYTKNDTLKLRRKAIKHIYQKCITYNCLECFYLATRIYDRYMKIKIYSGVRDKNILVALTSFFLSQIVILDDYIDIEIICGKEVYGTQCAILNMVDDIIKTLNFKIYEKTFDYMLFMKKNIIDYKKVYNIAQNANLLHYTQPILTKEYFNIPNSGAS